MGNTGSQEKQDVNTLNIDSYINDFKIKEMPNPISFERDKYILLKTNIDEIKYDIENKEYNDPDSDIDKKLKLTYDRQDSYIYSIFYFLEFRVLNSSDKNMLSGILEKYNYNSDCGKYFIIIYHDEDKGTTEYMTKSKKGMFNYTSVYKSSEQSASNVSAQFKNYLRPKVESMIKKECDISVIRLALRPFVGRGHANSILIEKYHKDITISLYEPHGKQNKVYGIKVDELLEIIKIVIEEKIKKLEYDFVVKINKESCDVGIQSFVAELDSGFCALFSLLWLDLNLYVKKRITEDLDRRYKGANIKAVGISNMVRDIEKRFMDSFNSKKDAYETVVGYCYFLLTKYLTDNNLTDKINNIILGQSSSSLTYKKKSITYKDALKLVNMKKPLEIYTMIEESEKPELTDDEIIASSYETYAANLKLLSDGKICASDNECESNFCGRGFGSDVGICAKRPFEDFNEEDDFLDILNYKKDDQFRLPRNDFTFGDIPTTGFTFGDIPTTGFTFGNNPTKGFTFGNNPTKGFTFGDNPTKGFTFGDNPTKGFNLKADDKGFN